jgi:hypothetical protein
VINEPPSEPGVNANDTEPSPGLATRSVGADGVVRGVTDTADDSAPSPATFTAFSLIVYGVPFVSPVINTGVDESAGSSADQLSPSSVEYL